MKMVDEDQTVPKDQTGPIQIRLLQEQSDQDPTCLSAALQDISGTKWKQENYFIEMMKVFEYFG